MNHKQAHQSATIHTIHSLLYEVPLAKLQNAFCFTRAFNGGFNSSNFSSSILLPHASFVIKSSSLFS